MLNTCTISEQRHFKTSSYLCCVTALLIVVKNACWLVSLAIFEQDRGKFLMAGLSRQAHGPESRGYFQQENVNLEDKEPGHPRGQVVLDELIFPTEPKSLRKESNILARKTLLTAPHMLSLTAYAESLRERLGSNVFVPDFDPLDGGSNAEFLFLFEKPGPKTDYRNGGSGFISRDNNDETANSVFDFMGQIGLERSRTLLWNTIPAWDDSRAFKGFHVRDGIKLLDELLPLLPKLKTIILVGRQAQKARRELEYRGFDVAQSDHPSPLVKARYRQRWEQIPAAWKNATSANKK